MKSKQAINNKIVTKKDCVVDIKATLRTLPKKQNNKEMESMREQRYKEIQ